MDSRAFRTLIDHCNKMWLGKVLNMAYAMNNGIDLVDEFLGVELKSRYNVWHSTFAVHAYQIEEFRDHHPDKELYWAFLIYGLSRPPRKIKGGPVGRFVTKRDVWFFDWDWIRQFPIWKPKTGPYVYVHARVFPPKKDFKNFRRGNGRLYVPKNAGMLIEKFSP